MHILSVQSSSRDENSVTRKLSDELIAKLREKGDVTLTEREASTGLPVVSTAWTQAAYMPEENRSPEQRESLRVSDELVAELKAADVLVIGAPVYNFTVPAALKLWIDQVCRANVTFKYTEQGPVGLLENKKAYVVVASGGVGLGTDYDFHSAYMRHILGFIGIKDVEFVDGSGSSTRGADAAYEAGQADIQRLAA